MEPTLRVFWQRNDIPASCARSNQGYQLRDLPASNGRRIVLTTKALAPLPNT